MSDRRREARPLTQAELAALAIITPADRAQAAAFWERHGTPLLRAMLEATLEEEGA